MAAQRGHDLHAKTPVIYTPVGLEVNDELGGRDDQRRTVAHAGPVAAAAVRASGVLSGPEILRVRLVVVEFHEVVNGFGTRLFREADAVRHSTRHLQEQRMNRMSVMMSCYFG